VDKKSRPEERLQGQEGKHHRADLDQRAYELRQQGLTYRAIAKWLGVTLAMARRRVLRHERTLRADEKAAPKSGF
jgi:transposase